jgi:hypothetical protein
MDNLNTTITTYLEMLNETDADRRAALVEQVWADDGCWIDPPFEAQGRAAINDAVGGVQQQFPGAYFRQVSGVDAHHDLFRFAWELVGADDAVIVGGIDVGQVAEDGRFRRVTGFLGELPEVAAA